MCEFVCAGLKLDTRYTTGRHYTTDPQVLYRIYRSVECVGLSVFLSTAVNYSLVHEDFAARKKNIIHAGGSRAVGNVISCVWDFACVSLCLSVCPRSTRKTARVINTKPVQGSRSECIDPDVKRSKVKVTWLSSVFDRGYNTIKHCDKTAKTKSTTVDFFSVLALLQLLQVPATTLR